MKISELVTTLQMMQTVHGDVDVLLWEAEIQRHRLFQLCPCDEIVTARFECVKRDVIEIMPDVLVRD